MMRQLCVDHVHLHCPRLWGTWFADTLVSKYKSKLGNRYANIFTQGKFTGVVPMMARSNAGKSLVKFTDDVGIPEPLVMDEAAKFTGRDTDFVKEACRMRIKLHTAEQGCKKQNHTTKREIGILSKRWKQRMIKKNVPKRLWDFDLVYESEILSRMARGTDCRTGYEDVNGQTADITLANGLTLSFTILYGGWIDQTSLTWVTLLDALQDGWEYRIVLGQTWAIGSSWKMVRSYWRCPSNM